MKIVTRQQFLQMPAGTVFSKFPLKQEGDGRNLVFGIQPPIILEEKPWEVCGGCIDFYYTGLGVSLFPKNRDIDYMDAMCLMAKEPGLEIEFDLSAGRDGLFQDENVGYMIYSREEVEEMIRELQRALNRAY